MARNPTAITDDVQLAGRFLAEQAEVLRRRGWLPFLLLAGAAVLGLALSRRPTGAVVRDGARLVERTVQVATALAAVERFRTHDRRAAA
jgi:hypothetical protein